VSRFDTEREEVRVAIAGLVLWICTVAVGAYLLATARRYGNTEAAPSEPVSVAAGQPSASPASVPAPAPATPARVKDPFAPPSLQRERSESPPLTRALVEFAHPTLGMTGFGFWFGYLVSHDRIFLAISLGILLGAIGAGLSWFTVNTRAVKRAAAAEAAGQPGIEDPRFAPQTFSPRVLVLHGAGAALTLLIAALITARV
jgi:hypothetical protein